MRGTFRRRGRRRVARGVASVLMCVFAAASCGPAAATPTPPPPTAEATAEPTDTPLPGVTSITITPAPRKNDTIASTAKSQNRYFGTAVQVDPLDYDDRYASYVASDFSSVTVEYAMRWNIVEPSQDEFNWDGADAIVAWAGSRGIKVRGQPLVWYLQLPAWLTNGQFDQATLAQLLEKHVTDEVGHFAGKIASWDVVTDPLNENGTLRSSLWSQVLGPDYIARVLQWAHAADPAAKLYINESNAEGLGVKSDALFNFVKALKTRGVPIDGVGLTTHLDATKKGVLPPGMGSNVQRFGGIGVEVAYTALDVRMHSPPLQDEPPQQLNLYRTAVRACFTQPACVGITVWGFTDRYSWIAQTYPGFGEADLFDAKIYRKVDLVQIVKEAMLP